MTAFYVQAYALFAAECCDVPTITSLSSEARKITVSEGVEHHAIASAILSGASDQAQP
jgi:hypothetical protein